MKKYIFILILLLLPINSVSAAGNLTDRLKGYILLQVQSHGEAWYLDPITENRYYMKDGATAYEMMRAFGLGITNTDLEKLLNGDQSLKQRLMGRIVLQVEAHGEAYYIDPHYGEIHYLKDGAEAYRLMRELSLGITDSDLNKIVSKNFSDYSQKIAVDPEPIEPVKETPIPTSDIIDDETLNQLNIYWLNKINNLRAQKDLRELIIDNRFVETASEWADYMQETDNMTHTRPDGKSMHQWIDTKDLDFTDRYSNEGWQTNYFTENISYGYVSDLSLSSLQEFLDDTLQMFLDEASYNGAHYRTIYHTDWNCLGIGYNYAPSNYGYKVYSAQHYGSLK